MATIQLVNFDGAESGGTEGLESEVGVDVVTSPAPWSSKEKYSFELGGGDNMSTKSHSPSGDWQTFGFWVYFDNFGSTNSQYTFMQCQKTDAHFHLDINTDGDLKIYDADGNLKSTLSGVIHEGRCHLIEIKFENLAGAGFDLYLDEVKKIDGLVGDWSHDTGSSNVSMYFINGQDISDGTKMLIGSFYHISDAGAGIDSEDTVIGKYTVVGSFESQTQATATPDYGDDLDSGSWFNCQSTPSNPSIVAHYDVSGLGDIKEGGVTTDSAQALVGGLNANPRIDGNIKGAKWMWVKNRSGTRYTFTGLYGKQAVGSEGTDNTSEKAGGPGLTGSVWITEWQTSGNIPDKDEWFQIGFKAEATVAGSGWAECVDMWCFVLQQEPRKVNQDGSVKAIS